MIDINASSTELTAEENHPPVGSNSLPSFSTYSNELWSYEIPEGAFTDEDGDLLTYSANLYGGNPLPEWLTFNAETKTFTGIPTNDDLDFLNITVTATDSFGAIATDLLVLGVSLKPEPPVLALPLVDTTATQDQAFSFAIPEGSFTDADTAVLTYTATLADGTALPTWLVFDALAGTFAGTPGASDLGSLEVKVIATDGSASVEDVFALVVAPLPLNNGPVLALPLVDTTATADELFSFTIPTGSFTDADANDVLTYSATLTDGTALPSWLVFDAVAGTFTGTPSASDIANLEVKVIATDGLASIDDVFALVVGAAPLPLNNAPVLALPLVDTTATADELFSFTIPVGSFTDADTPVLTYSATLADGTALPTWLVFNAVAGTFTGTPGASDLASLQIKVIATDGLAAAEDVFALVVGAAPLPPNTAPVITLPLVDTTATEGQSFSFTIPEGSFTDADVNDELTYAATLLDGTALPTWLVFDAVAGTFAGTPGASDLASLEIKVTATDKAGATVNDVFQLAVAGGSTPVPPAPEVPPVTIQNATDGVWNVSGAGKVKVSVSGNTSDKFNEVGVFKLDADNKVNGFAVGDAGFAKAVLESGRVVFSILPDRITDGLDLSRSFQVSGGEKLGFFTIADGTVEGDLSSNNFTNVITSVDALKPFAVTQSQGAFTLDLKQGDKNLSFNFQVDNTPASVLDTISSQQGNKEGEMFDLRGLTGQKVEATFTLKRDAGYNDSVSFYKIDDAAGTVTSGGKQFHPGEPGYIEAALANAISGLKLAAKNGETLTVSQMMDGGSLYAPIMTSNVTSNSTGEIYTAFAMGNSDRTDHVRLLGDNTFGFEDLYNGGDKDFNDVLVKATFKVV